LLTHLPTEFLLKKLKKINYEYLAAGINMKKMNQKQIRILKIVHIFFFVIWIGGGLGLIALMFLAVPAAPDDIYMKFRSMQVIDDYIIIPGALGSLAAGFVYGIWTGWGFFKHKWITVKWVMTTVQILFGTFALGPWLNKNVEITHQLRGTALSNSDFINNTAHIQLWGSVQVLLLLFMLVISVLKPWRKVNP